MQRTIAYAAAATLVAGGCLLGSRPAGAQAGAMHDEKAVAQAAKPAAGETPAAGSWRAKVVRQIAEAQKKLTSLAEATPAEKYSWRPGTGVRSVGEVYMHVASANLYFPTLWGAKPLAGVDPRALEKDGGDKAKTMAALKQSFDYLNESIAAISDADLAKPISFFGRPSTGEEVLLGLATHAHEHLGQAIAYARMNGVVPPWSAEPGPRGGK